MQNQYNKYVLYIPVEPYPVIVEVSFYKSNTKKRPTSQGKGAVPDSDASQFVFNSLL
ncbi:hypothetical protein GCM10010912_32450 [Paenibacillus albidus]|uniref:Uncharacterized protein n=1 Tax=Paenibacillus albidus TaxID=2041023 RepID=A0A917CDG8_9BACL|nr:hypothetical protein GCM10010912_32450 [Paenibacillus albidus]